MTKPKLPLSLMARNQVLEDQIVQLLRNAVGFSSTRNLAQVLERALLRFALERFHGVHTLGARLLGCGRITFAKKLRAHGLRAEANDSNRGERPNPHFHRCRAGFISTQAEGSAQ